MPKKILIIEDDNALRTALVRRFGDLNYDILEASDGKSGLKTALDQHPDVLLVDIAMPIMNGMDMIEKLRKDKWGKTANVILLTNLDDYESLSKAIALDVHTYLTKSDNTMSGVVEIVENELPN